MKKIITCLLSITLCLSMSLTPLAAEVILQENIEQNNKLNASQFAESFVEMMFEDPYLDAENVNVIYDENDEISGYCVDIDKENTEYGYVIIKFNNNEPVVSEFCVEPGAINPYEYIIDSEGIENEELKYFSLSANEYQIYDANKKMATGTDSRNLTNREFSDYKNKVKKDKENKRNRSTFDSHLNYSSLNGWTVISDSYQGTVEERDALTYAYYLTLTCQEDIEEIGETYACSVVALCNLMRYYRMRGFDGIPADLQTLYDDMWEYAGTSSNGSTTDGNEAIAARNYLRDLGHSCSTNSFLFDTYSNFKNAIESDKPCILTYGADFGGTNGGHAVLVMGYVQTTSYNYLQVADGWNTYLRYINFNGYDYSRLNGWSISASE